MSLFDLPAFVPDWDLPKGVRALQTERGPSAQPYGAFNLGDHVGDDPQAVAINRNRLAQVIGAVPVWMTQVHGTRVLDLTNVSASAPEADAAMTRVPGIACAIMTADCLPVLVADRQARVVGAAHAGWRGLADGVIDELIRSMTRVPGVAAGDLSVWLGPAIGPTAFEVGQDVVDAFMGGDAANNIQANVARCFRLHPVSPGKYLADLPALAALRLRGLGVDHITQSGLCTVSAPERFYSYRRESVTGRMASLIWLE